MLWYERFGKGGFRELARLGELSAAKRAPMQASGAPPLLVHTRFDVRQADEQSNAAEAEIWHELVQQRRKVTREDYEALAERAPTLRSAPGLWRCAAGESPERVPGPAQGRRQSHAPNACKQQRSAAGRRAT